MKTVAVSWRRTRHVCKLRLDMVWLPVSTDTKLVYRLFKILVQLRYTKGGSAEKPKYKDHGQYKLSNTHGHSCDRNVWKNECKKVCIGRDFYI